VTAVDSARSAAVARWADQVGPDRRRSRSDGADIRLASLFGAALAGVGHSFGSPSGFALVAVGGYGRRELAPASDLDVVLVHSDRRISQAGRELAVAGVAERLWYPLWDDGVRLDHAVRTVGEARTAAASDLRTALGLLDGRHLAGDQALTTELRTSVLADWRGSARRRLPDLHGSVRGRADRFGELAHAQSGDLKQARGGLRDLVVLDALVASWLVDVPHRRVDAARSVLLDVRDALHAVTGRAGDRLGLDDQPDVAAALGMAGRTELLRAVSSAARAVSLVSDVVWRRVDTLLTGPVGGPPGTDRRRRARPGPVLVPLADGVAAHDGEVVLTVDADPAADPGLALRVAAVAARTGQPVAPATADRLARSAAIPAAPWPDAHRGQLVDALGAGPGLVGVWEVFDEAGVLDRMFPVWSEIRCLPSSSPVHRWTVDRHSIGTVVEAARLLRRVDRPDLLLVAALLHDIGKGAVADEGMRGDHGTRGDQSTRGDHGSRGDHSAAGEPLARRTASELGFDAADAGTVALLVRRHLLLPELATTRDVEDPATAAAVARLLPDAATLDLLAALTEADARATGPAAWSPWRAQLVQRLTERARAELAGSPPPEPATADVPARLRALGVAPPAGSDPAGPVVLVGPSDGDAHTLTTVSADRPGLLAALAGVLSLDRLVVRGAAVASADGTAIVDWVLTRSAEEPPDEPRLRTMFSRALAGNLDVAARLAARDLAGRAPTDAAPVADARSSPRSAAPPAEAEVALLADASATATVLQVRAADRPGLLFTVCSALTGSGAVVRSAHVSTLGGEVVDVFYLLGVDGGALPPDRAEAVRAAVATAVG